MGLLLLSESPLPLEGRTAFLPQSVTKRYATTTYYLPAKLMLGTYILQGTPAPT